MKYILGILCGIVGFILLFDLKVIKDLQPLLGSAFCMLGILFFNAKFDN